MATNNSFNLPLDDNQVILGKTGLVPEVATLTPGTNMSIVASPGALTFNSVDLLAGTNMTLTPGVGNLTLNSVDLIAGSNITLTPGAGSITITSTATASSLWTQVQQTFSPPGGGNQLVMSPNTLYDTGNNTAGFNVQYVLPGVANRGEYFLVAAHPPCGPTVSVLAAVGGLNVCKLQNLATTVTNATFQINQTGFLWMMCVGVIAGFLTYQVISSSPNVVFT